MESNNYLHTEQNQKFSMVIPIVILQHVYSILILHGQILATAFYFLSYIFSMFIFNLLFAQFEIKYSHNA
jgi:hypothetical protein